MNFRVLVSLSLILVLLVMLVVPVFAALSTLGQDRDYVNSTYFFSGAPQAGQQHGWKLTDSADGDNGYIYAYTNYTNASGVDEVFTYRVNTSGTFMGTSEIDRQAVSMRRSAVILANDTVDPKMYVAVGQSGNSAYAESFTITSAGSISAVIDSHTLWTWNASFNSIDGFYVSDGVVCVTGFGRHAGNNTGAVVTFTVQSDGDINPGGSNIDSAGLFHAYADYYGFCEIFPITTNLDGTNWPENRVGAGWWGVIAGAYSGNDQPCPFGTFYVDSAGNLTVGDQKASISGGLGAIETDTAQPVTSPVRIFGTSDEWIMSSEDYMTSIQITNSGSINTTAIDQVSVFHKYGPRIIWVGGNRYITYCTSAVNSGMAFCGYDIESSDLSVTDQVACEAIGQAVPGWGIGSNQNHWLWPSGITGVYHMVGSDTNTNDIIGYSWKFFAPPSIDTTGLSGISETSATGAGEVLSEGSSVPTVAGLCWSDISASPTVSGSHTSTAGLYTQGSTWSDLMDNLQDGTKYWMRAYATSPDGTGYGDTLSFSTIVGYNTNVMYSAFDAETITWTSSGTITDQSVNGNDIHYDFGPMDSDLDITVGGLLQTTSFYSPESTAYNIPDVFEPVSQSEGMYQEGQGEDLPVFELVEDAAEGMEWTTGILYSFIMIVSAMALGVGVMIATGSLMLGISGTALLMLAGISSGVLPLWLFLVYILFALGYLVVSRSM